MLGRGRDLSSLEIVIRVPPLRMASGACVVGFDRPLVPPEMIVFGRFPPIPEFEKLPERGALRSAAQRGTAGMSLHMDVVVSPSAVRCRLRQSKRRVALFSLATCKDHGVPRLRKT